MTNQGHLIKKARVAKGYNQAQLGDYLGVTGSFINKIENGRGKWPSRRLPDLCKILRISRTEFINAMTKDFERSVR